MSMEGSAGRSVAQRALQGAVEHAVEQSVGRDDSQRVEGHISLGSDEDSSSEIASSSDAAGDHTMSGGMRCDLASPQPYRQSFPADTPLTPMVGGRPRQRCDTEAFDDQACLNDSDVRMIRMGFHTGNFAMNYKEGYSREIATVVMGSIMDSILS